ncbi:hypothetical protein Naga_101058g1 [Nannochloropsis gaditana]|uniref:Uncharacterized protein n=1 Tax=Nannochloropsis gaditana TaxID=72520 RepID=W7TIM9_9STRA|nr:hypothetical protein Naga_101058g1 [Nannochloropsis gaditana]
MPYTSMHHRHIRALSCREKAWATPGSGMIRRAMGSNRRGRSGRPPLLSLVLLLLLFTILPFVEGGIYGFWKWFRGHYKEVVSKVSSEQYAEFDHVLIDVNQVD